MMTILVLKDVLLLLSMSRLKAGCAIINYVCLEFGYLE